MEKQPRSQQCFWQGWRRGGCQGQWSFKQTKELGQIKVFWSGRHSRGRWESIGLRRAVGAVHKISPFSRPYHDHFVQLFWELDHSPDLWTSSCPSPLWLLPPLNHFSFLLFSMAPGYFPPPVLLGDRKKKEKGEEVARRYWCDLGVARQGWPREPKAWGRGQFLVAVLSCRDSQCPLHHCHVLVAATEAATTCWAAGTHLPLPDNSLLINSHISCYILVWCGCQPKRLLASWILLF